MTLDDLGNIGEFLGAIGVIATLAYLAVQIRQNTRMMRASIRQSRSDSMQQAFTHSANGNIAEIMVKDRNHEQLTDVERQRLQMWQIGSWRARETTFLQAKDGMLDDSTFEQQANIVRRVMEAPYTRESWTNLKATLDPSFQGWVDDIIAALPEEEQ